jgi:hypothetical protein
MSEMLDRQFNRGVEGKNVIRMEKKMSKTK